MSKHKDKDRDREEKRGRDELYSREHERSKDRDRRRRSRSRSKDRRERRKKSKERRRSKEKTSKSDRPRHRTKSKERSSRRSRSKESRRSRSRDRSNRKSATPPLSHLLSAPTSRFEVSAAQQAQISQFLSASLSGLTQPSTTVHSIAQHVNLTQPLSEPIIRTDFSNLFQSSSATVTANSSAIAIAAARAKDLLKAKNLTDSLTNTNNGNSVTSNGNASSHDEGEEFRLGLGLGLGSAENSISALGCDANSNSEGDRKRKKKSRWATTTDGPEKTFIPGMPTILPSNLNPDQQEAYLVQLQIEEISRKLRTGDLGIPQNLEERSPSPEPIYSSDGKRLNTREFRTRKKLEEQRHMLITRMQCMNPDFKPPADYKPPVIRVSDKVLIPQEEHPDINFVGLLIGPRGNTLKAMEKDTGAKIIIRGKGSVKEGKVGRKDGQPLPGEDEPLHAFITASNPEAVKKAVDKIKDVIKQGIEVPEGHNDLRRMQLRELAQLNGTLRETDGPRCTNCGSTDHKSWLCPDKPNVTNNIVCSACGGAGHIAKDCKSKRPGMGGIEGSNNQAKIDEEYLSLMAELGEVQPQEAPVAPREPVQQTSRPYSIFDNPRHQAPRQICSAPQTPNPPMMQNSAPPPWTQHQNQHTQQQQLALPAHPMGQYPPPPVPWQSNTQMPPMNQPPGMGLNPPLPGMLPPGINPSIPPPPGTDCAPPGTTPYGFEEERFSKKPPIPSGSWNSPPPIPPGNFWSQPPLPNYILPPPPPPAD